MIFVQMKCWWTAAHAVSEFYRQLKKTEFKKIKANSESMRLLYHIGKKKYIWVKKILQI